MTFSFRVVLLLDSKSKEKILEELERIVKNCTKCPLHEGRTNAVFGDGNIDADIMFIGEAPGRNEDLQGKPFVGQAGKLLTEAIESIGLNRSDVYITNVVKCRPPKNRDPTKEEIAACEPYLDKQISIINPSIIVTLGRFAMRYMLNKYNLGSHTISKVRGRIFELHTLDKTIYFIPTYHPAAILYRQGLKFEFQSDFMKIKELLGKIKLKRK